MARPSRYFGDDGKTPRADLFDNEAREEARAWVGSDIKTSQVRRFFGQVMADKRQLELKGVGAQDEEAQVAMALLKASTAYTAAREKNRKPLAEFAHHHAGLVKSIPEFKAFARHFEAVVAWHRVFEEENKANFGAPGGRGGGGHADRAQRGHGARHHGGGYRG